MKLAMIVWIQRILASRVFDRVLLYGGKEDTDELRGLLGLGIEVHCITRLNEPCHVKEFDIAICAGEALNRVKNPEALVSGLAEKVSFNGGLVIIAAAGPKYPQPGNLKPDDIWNLFDREAMLELFEKHAIRYGRHTVNASYDDSRECIIAWGSK